MGGITCKYGLQDKERWNGNTFVKPGNTLVAQFCHRRYVELEGVSGHSCTIMIQL